MNFKSARNFLALVGLVMGGAWAVAVTAAEYVMRPHMSAAETRVAVMCAWSRAQDDYARRQNENTIAICKVIGAKCEPMPTQPANPLLIGCEE